MRAPAAQAVSIATYTFKPEPVDLWGLSHHYAYEWGIDFSPHTQYEIVEATFTFHNIYNWRAEDNWLHINLLDDPRLGTTVYYDGYNVSDNYFNDQGRLLDTWSDIPGGAPGSDLSLTFSDLRPVIAPLVESVLS